MLRIERTASGDVLIIISGRLDRDHVAELEGLIGAEPAGRRIVLDLKDVTQAGQEEIEFLASCESGGIELNHCPLYIRESIKRRRR